MKSIPEIGVGLLGFGTVGTGVVRGLQANGDLLAARAGARIVLRRIADLDLATDRGVPVALGVLTTDAQGVLADPDVQIIVELIGGTTVARELVLASLAQGKPVVTANKALLAEHGAALFEAAARHRTDLYFEAAVGGGIPIIRALREGLVANRIQRINGILNGTCNYILTRMEAEGLPFDTVLAEAQAKGYAEADPGLDIDGLDTAHKAVILASLAYGLTVPMDAVHVEGIRGLAASDIASALALGYRIKQLAVIKQVGAAAEVRVHPALVPLDNVLASVSGVFNAVLVSGDMTGDTLYYGRGAGAEPTASAVLGDIVDVARNLVAGSPCRLAAMAAPGEVTGLRPMSDVTTRYYLRLALVDEPGVLARIATVLGAHAISIASVEQREQQAGEYVPVVIVTHEAREDAMCKALQEINALPAVGAGTVRLRIEE